MRLWTVQPHSVLGQVERRGVARVEPERRRDPDHIPPAFLWLNDQLRGRLIDYDAELPWWAYRRKPDLRQHRWTALPGGSRQVRIELELKAEEAIDFPIWAWDRVFCRQYLGTRVQERDFKRRLRAAGFRPWDDEIPENFQRERGESWLRLFGPLAARRNWCGEWGGREAVFGEIRRHHIKSVTHFRCRPTLRT